MCLKHLLHRAKWSSSPLFTGQLIDRKKSWPWKLQLWQSQAGLHGVCQDPTLQPYLEDAWECGCLWEQVDTELYRRPKLGPQYHAPRPPQPVTDRPWARAPQALPHLTPLSRDCYHHSCLCWKKPQLREVKWSAHVRQLWRSQVEIQTQFPFTPKSGVLLPLGHSIYCLPHTCGRNQRLCSTPSPKWSSKRSHNLSPLHLL